MYIGRFPDQLNDSTPLGLHWLPGRLAVCRLDAAASLPSWIESAHGLVSWTRTDAELSIVIDEDQVPADVRAERGWRGMRVDGPLDFALTGILARLTGALADAAVPVFALSTYDTDILLVRVDDAERAVEALGVVADVSALRC